jgi:hypothetical protein
MLHDTEPRTDHYPATEEPAPDGIDQEPALDRVDEPAPDQLGRPAAMGVATPPAATEPPTTDTEPPTMATEPPTTVWAPEAAREFHERWRELQLRFVDDPRVAADEAAALVEEALDQFSATITSRKHELDAWRGGDGAAATDGDEDRRTERMRTAVRSYRGLLDRLLEV